MALRVLRDRAVRSIQAETLGRACGWLQEFQWISYILLLLHEMIQKDFPASLAPKLSTVAVVPFWTVVQQYIPKEIFDSRVMLFLMILKSQIKFIFRSIYGCQRQRIAVINMIKLLVRYHSLDPCFLQRRCLKRRAGFRICLKHDFRCQCGSYSGAKLMKSSGVFLCRTKKISASGGLKKKQKNRAYNNRTYKESQKFVHHVIMSTGSDIQLRAP